MATTTTKHTPAPKPAAAPTPQIRTLTAVNVHEFLFSPHVQSQIALALPQHLKPERMIRMALTTVRRTPKLLECDPTTLVACIVQASELGLELSGPLGQAYMIPRKNKGRMEACFQIGFRGFLRLAHNTGQVAYFNARAVRVGDLFEFELGTDQRIRHVPGSRPTAKITHFYSVLKLNNGAADCEVWTLEKVEAHRDQFRSDKFLKDQNRNYQGPWDTSFEAMGCKTLIRELAKRAPLSPEVMSLAARDEYAEAGAPTPNAPAEFIPENGQPPPADSARPETLDEIYVQLQRAGVYGQASAELQAKYADAGGELSESGALAMLKELSAMEDIHAGT